MGWLHPDGVTQNPNPYTPPPDPSPGTTTRLGLHVTADELAVWRSRALGLKPHNFIADGDEYVNSPGDWNRIVGYKDEFMATPTGTYAWLGATHNWPNAIINNNQWPTSKPEGLPPVKGQVGSMEPARDAAFYAMVMGADQVSSPATQISAATRDAIIAKVRDSMLLSVRSQYNDFTNTQRFDDTNFGPAFGYVYPVSQWLGQMAVAYDYCQIAAPSVWSTAEKTEFLTWITSAERWWMATINGRRDIGRISDSTGRALAAGIAAFNGGLGIWLGGGVESTISRKVDNHLPAQAQAVVIPALLCELEDARSGVNPLTQAEIDSRLALIDWFVTNYLTAEFIAAADGTSGGFGSGKRAGAMQFYRGLTDDAPNDGWKYAVEWLARVMTMVDWRARAGDTAFYERSTTEGITVGSLSTAGSVLSDPYFLNPGPKTFRRAAQQISRYIIETGPESYPWRYGHTSIASETQRIDSVSEPTNDHRSQEYEFLHLNLRWRDAKLARIWDRSLTNTPNHGPKPRQGQYLVYNGDRGLFPGTCFMYMYVWEDDPSIWPYPGSPP